MNENIKNIIDKLESEKIKVDQTEIEQLYTNLTKKFFVPDREASNTILKKYGYKFSSGGVGSSKSSEIINIKQITGSGAWLSVKGKITQLWDTNSDAISQTGLIADETGQIKFTIFSKNKALFNVQEGSCYLFENVVTSIYNEKTNISLNKNSKVTQLDEDIEVFSQKITIAGVFTDVLAASGFIKRCPECNRALIKGACGEHGRVDGNIDLRIKAIFVADRINYETIGNKEITEKILGYTLDQAKTKCMECLDTGVVFTDLESALLGNYFELEGSVMDKNTFLVSAANKISLSEKIPEIKTKIEELLKE